MENFIWARCQCQFDKSHEIERDNIRNIVKAFCVQNRLIWDSGPSELCIYKSNKYSYPYIHPMFKMCPKGWNKQAEAVDIYCWYVATLLQPVWFHLQISLCQSAVKSYKWSLHSRLLGRGHWTVQTSHSVLLCSRRQL